MPIYDFAKLLQSNTANTVAAVTTDKVNAAVTTPGYNKGGVPWGLHMIVTTSYGSLTEGLRLQILQSAADDLTTASEIHSEMFIAVSDLTAGKHYFVPAGSRDLKQYLCGCFTPVNTAANAGKSTMFFGPKSGGED